MQVWRYLSRFFWTDKWFICLPKYHVSFKVCTQLWTPFFIFRPGLSDIRNSEGLLYQARALSTSISHANSHSSECSNAVIRHPLVQRAIYCPNVKEWISPHSKNNNKKKRSSGLRLRLPLAGISRHETVTLIIRRYGCWELGLHVSGTRLAVPEKLYVQRSEKWNNA
jgi:hypothetical protein